MRGDEQMTSIPNFSPGCFGSALGYQDDSPICKNCPFKDECIPLHDENLATLRAKFGITPKQKAVKASTARPNPAAGVMALPAKVQALVDKLDAANLRIGEKLLRGENPFEGKVPFLQVACHLLLRLGRPVERSLLSQALTHKFGWQQNTADAHARMAFQALAHIGVIVESEAGAIIKGAENVE